MKKKGMIIIFLIGLLGVTVSLLYLLKDSEDGNVNPKDKETQETIVETGNNIVENDQQTGFVNSGVVVEDVSVQKDEILTGEITVLMPSFLFDEGLREMAKELEDDDIVVHFELIEEWNVYKELVKSQLDSKQGADVLMIPSDWLDTVDSYSKKIDLGEQQLAPYFHTVFEDFVDDPNYLYLPFAMDPFVVYADPIVDVGDGVMDLDDIWDYMNLYEQKKIFAIALMWGTDKNALRLLKIGGESFVNYFLILYNLVYQGETADDDEFLSKVVQIGDANLENSWNFADYKLLYKRIDGQNDYCDWYPSICLFAYKFADIRFGFLSDQKIWKKYFGKAGRSVDTVEIYNFPVGGGDYLIRGWGFVSPRYSRKTNLVEEFMKNYLRQGVAGKLAVRDGLWSPFVNVWNEQRKLVDFASIVKYENIFALIYGGMDFQESFLEENEVVNDLRFTSNSL